MTSIFPVAYFGNIAYFKKLIAAENVIIEGFEHFEKQTIRTRCEILTSNGIQVLSVPVERKNGSKTCLKDISISDHTDWQKQHWKAIESAYASAPFFEHYESEIKALIYQNERSLIHFNLRITEQILDWLDIDKKMPLSTEYMEGEEIIDYRKDDFNLKETNKKYIQVFSPKNEFAPNLSMLDLIFCEGPLARKWVIT